MPVSVRQRDTGLVVLTKNPHFSIGHLNYLFGGQFLFGAEIHHWNVAFDFAGAGHKSLLAFRIRRVSPAPSNPPTHRRLPGDTVRVIQFS